MPSPPAISAAPATRARRPTDQATLHFFWLSVAFFGLFTFSFSGRLDRLADLRLALPFILLVIAVIAVIGPSLVVVIVILGVLAALVVPKIIERPDEAKVIAAKSDIATVMQALKLYRLDNQRYPTAEQGIGALITKPEQPPVPPNWKPGGYLEKLPKDPWGRPYVYLNPGVRGDIEVFSFGADGQPGGSGFDADVGSWDL